MDEVPSVEDIAVDVYLEFAATQKQHVIDHPICEICKTNPSVRITRWGRIQAACEECLEKELAAFNEFCKQEEEYDEFLKDKYG